MFKHNSGKSQETSPLDETRGDQIYVCISYDTMNKQEAGFNDLSMCGLVPFRALDSHSMCGSCFPEGSQKKSCHPSCLSPWLWLLLSLLPLSGYSVVGTDDRSHL